MSDIPDELKGLVAEPGDDTIPISQVSDLRVDSSNIRKVLESLSERYLLNDISDWGKNQDGGITILNFPKVDKEEK